MIGSWIATLLLLLLVAKAILDKHRKPSGVFDVPFSRLVEDDRNDAECIFEDGMSEYEMAVAFISSGRCRLSDAAVAAVHPIHHRNLRSTDSTNRPQWAM